MLKRLLALALPWCVVAIFSACQSTGTSATPELLNKRVNLHYALGVDALRKGNLPKAFDELLHAEQMAPDRADVLAALAYAWQLRGNLDKAHAYYVRAIENNPSPATYNNYGGLLLVMNKPEEAEKYFRKALDDPRYRHPDIAYINLGDALLAEDRFNEAIAAYRQAKTLNPGQELSRIREAQAYVRYKRFDYARALYETILRDSPGNRRAIAGLLPLLKKNGNLTEARRQLERFHARTSIPADKAWAEETLKGLGLPLTHGSPFRPLPGGSEQGAVR